MTCSTPSSVARSATTTSASTPKRRRSSLARCASPNCRSATRRGCSNGGDCAGEGRTNTAGRAGHQGRPVRPRGRVGRREEVAQEDSRFRGRAWAAGPAMRPGRCRVRRVVGQAESLEQQRVDRDQEAGSGHGQGGDLGAEHQAERGFEHAGGDGQRDGVVADGPAQVLPHLAQRARPIRSATGTSSGSERISTMSAVSMATSVPAPIAIPTSAWASAGASFTPSPTIATRRPASCKL